MNSDKGVDDRFLNICHTLDGKMRIIFSKISTLNDHYLIHVVYNSRNRYLSV